MLILQLAFSVDDFSNRTSSFQFFMRCIFPVSIERSFASKMYAKLNYVAEHPHLLDLQSQFHSTSSERIWYFSDTIKFSDYECLNCAVSRSPIVGMCL